ncbi:MAG: plasmid stabilization protein [Actinomycetota bacterium]|jgi:plasmid stability protein|nr:plasmid stabilization protein [Actinomycetota bacterium]
MAAVSIRDLDDEVRDLLRQRAAVSGVSMEEEMRRILTEAVRPQPTQRSLFDALRDAALEYGGVDLDIPSRKPHVDRVDFSR